MKLVNEFPNYSGPLLQSSEIISTVPNLDTLFTEERKTDRSVLTNVIMSAWFFGYEAGKEVEKARNDKIENLLNKIMKKDE